MQPGFAQPTWNVTIDNIFMYSTGDVTEDQVRPVLTIGIQLWEVWGVT
jgi:hypothetical protein